MEKHKVLYYRQTKGTRLPPSNLRAVFENRGFSYIAGFSKHMDRQFDTHVFTDDEMFGCVEYLDERGTGIVVLLPKDNEKRCKERIEELMSNLPHFEEAKETRD